MTNRTLKRLVCCSFEDRAYYCPICGPICDECWSEEINRHFYESEGSEGDHCEVAKENWGWELKNRRYCIVPGSTDWTVNIGRGHEESLG